MSKPPDKRLFTPAEILTIPASSPPILVAVIDTEEEFDWHAPFDAAATSTENIGQQNLGQRIFDHYSLVPTYVIDYPVASEPRARSLLRAILDDGRCEIGAHLHPWVNPPAGGPIDAFHSYPGNLPPEREYAKLSALTACIAQEFGKPPAIYKAGRYGIGPASEATLVKLGYRIDVSVVPYSDFSADGGPNFSRFAARPFLSSRGLIVLPLSVTFVGVLARAGSRVYPPLATPLGQRLHAPGIAARLGLLERLRLSPEGHSASDMQRQTRAAIAKGVKFFMLTYHSSSLLPRGSPYVQSEDDRLHFLNKIETYIDFFIRECDGRVASVSEAAAYFAHAHEAKAEPAGRASGK